MGLRLWLSGELRTEVGLGDQEAEQRLRWSCTPGGWGALAHGMLCVPEAAAEHPWWCGGRRLLWHRFYSWARGDSELYDLWPSMAFRTAPP
ncbi:uncharacterized protein HaLaN_20803, partial [Haematococcus lacustris]